MENARDTESSSRGSRAADGKANGLLDRLDRQILRHLQDDGRRPYREIARTVGVSEGTVRARVRKLQETGVVRMVAVPDFTALGDSILAAVLVHAAPGSHEALIEELVKQPEVSYAATILGPAEIILEVVCPDNQALWQWVNDVLRRMEGVIKAEPMMILKVHKMRYDAALV